MKAGPEGDRPGPDLGQDSRRDARRCRNDTPYTFALIGRGPMQIDLSAFFEVPLLNPTYLGRLQDLLGTLAPSWSNGLRICDRKEGTPQIRVKSANSLYESVWHDITRQSPHYKRLVRQFGPPKHERPCGMVELGGDDRSMAVGKRPVNRIFKTASGRGMMFGAPSCRTRARRT
jgi:hypothetical protein